MKINERDPSYIFPLRVTFVARTFFESTQIRYNRGKWLKALEIRT